MSSFPSPPTVGAWARLLRAHHTVLTAIESDLKLNGMPPLAWYEALLELARAPGGRLRPLELERQLLLPQYSTSRLLDRLARAGLVTKEACPEDRRGHLIAITP